MGIEKDNGATFSSRTLLGNWSEERQLLSKHADGSSAHSSKATSFARIFGMEAGAHQSPSLFMTTKLSSDQSLIQAQKNNAAAGETLAVKPKSQNLLFSGSTHTLDERVATYGRPTSLAYTLPPAAGKQAEDNVKEERRFDSTTTNQVYYQDRVAQARASPPKPGGSPSLTSPGSPYLTNLSTGTLNSPSGGDGARRGRMGELTRNPKEAGSVYGVSVWADEYAQWGDKLKGMSLNESRSRATTKYF